MENNELGLAGKVAIVTGSAQGIGKAMVTRFARYGAKVVVTDIQEEKGRAVAEELGGDAMFYPCDVSEEDQGHGLVDAVAKKHGRLDILVNNAGYSGRQTRVYFDEFLPEAWRGKMACDLNGTFYLCQAAAPHMARQGSGCIINIASIAGVVALRNQIHHDTAKAAIIRMSQELALELGPNGIRVNSISPGSTASPGVLRAFYADDAIYKEQGKQLLTFIPLGRPADPDEIAKGALFLASDLASYVTGHNLIIDGGWTAGYNRDY